MLGAGLVVVVGAPGASPPPSRQCGRDRGGSESYTEWR